jgi:hypothetical protein
MRFDHGLIVQAIPIFVQAIPHFKKRKLNALSFKKAALALCALLCVSITSEVVEKEKNRPNGREASMQPPRVKIHTTSLF